MVKKLIKRQIKKTGTYRVLKIQNQKLIQRVQSLENENQNLKVKLKKKKKEKLKYVKYSHILRDNLIMEIRSLKSVFVDDEKLKKDSDLDNLTIVIPYRKDDEDRRKNLDILLKYLSYIGISSVIISEHSDVSGKESLTKSYQDFFENFKVIWNHANGEIFNKSLAINRGVMTLSTPYFAVFDSDCLTKKENINIAVNLLDKGFDLVHPFNRMVTDIVDKAAFIKQYNFNTVKSPSEKRSWADGGITFWNKKSFTEIGMNNEYFGGWGGEDNELMYRTCLFQLKNFRIEDTLYHLYHERPQLRNKNNDEQEDKIRKLTTKEECVKEISKWPWIVDLKKNSR